ncbi:MAG TPA: glucuronate isomerase [Planctomycetia bacterium]|nr:glucuronate isomerase [Planctomycetia bacterium]
MDLGERRLRAEIEKIPIVDPHSHVDPRSPTAAGLNDLLGYHYYTELAHSAGMPKTALEATGQDLARAIAEWLPRLANTVQYDWLVHLAREFFGFPEREVTTRNIEQLYAAVAATCAQPDWADQVFAKSNLEAIFLTNDFDDPLEGFDVKRYVPCLRTDDLAFKLDQENVRTRFAATTGHEATSPASLEKGFDKLFERFVARGARACAISLPPDLEPSRPSHAEAAHLVDAALAGNLSDGDRKALASWTIFALADRCEEFKLPFDLMIGVRRDVYPDGVHQGRDLLDQRTSLYSYRKLFNAKAKVTFPVSVLTHVQNQELASFAWIFPNVVASGHWWYANVPAYIEADLRARLEAVPLGKQIGYYSDAYKLEFVLPKYATYKRCLTRVLYQDFIIARGWSEEQAVDAALHLLRENALAIFGGGN